MAIDSIDSMDAEGAMTGEATGRRAQVAALLAKLPYDATFEFARAAGVFRPVLPFIDVGGSTPAGAVLESSLRAFWKWCSKSLSQAAVGEALAVFAASAAGVATSREQVRGAVRTAQAAIGRGALDAVETRSFAQRVEELGSERAAQDAELIAQLLVLAEKGDLFAEADEPPWRSVPEAVVRRALAWGREEPDCVGAILCMVIAKLEKPARAVPLALELAGRRAQGQLDGTGLNPALDFMLERACAYGAPDLIPEGRPSGATAEIVAERARRVRKVAAALRENVSPAWLRRFNTRVKASSGALEQMCARCANGVERMMQQPRAPLAVGEVNATLAAVEFLSSVADSAVALSFDDARQQAIEGIRVIVRDTYASALDARLQATPTTDAIEAIIALTLVVELLDGAAAANAWAREKRRLIGRPSFQEDVMSVVDPVVVRRTAPRSGQVSQDLLDRLWRWVSTGALAPALVEAESRFDATRDAGPFEAARVASDFKALLRQSIREGLDAGELARDLGLGVDEHAQLETVVALLACERDILNLIGESPERAKHLLEPEVASLRALHDRVSSAWPYVQPALLLLVMTRLERPWQILRALERIAKTRSDVLLEATEYVSVGHVLIDHAEEDARLFSADASGGFRADPVIAALERFAGVASGMTEEFEIRKDGAWGRRLYALKGRAAKDLERICEATVRSIEVITPRRMLGGGRWGPETGVTLDPRSVRDAVERARFIRLSKILDHRAAFGGVRAKTMLQLDARLDGQIEALLEQAHADVAREAALAHLQALADVVRALRGEEAGHIVRRRAAAA